MKFEVILVIVIGAFIYDAYYCGGKYMRWIQSLRRYYKTAMYIGGAIFIYMLMKSGDRRSQDVFFHGFNFLKSLPLERSYVNGLSPIFDMTGGGSGGSQEDGFMSEINDSGVTRINPLFPAKVPRRGMLPTKRSVSEAKKRYVAASQNWQCANCQQLLNHTFEVDHITRLEFGGSNDVNNLSALCRNCHGIKTARENIEKSDL